MPRKGYKPKGSTRGRKRKPTELHILNGNPSLINIQERIDAEPKFEKIAPDCPDWLDEYAKEEWNRLAPELERLGLLTQVDLAALAAYCENFATWRKANEIIEREGIICETTQGGLKKHPAVSIRSDAFEKMKAFLIEFGFTPASRSRVNIAESNKKSEKKKVGDLMSR